MAPCPNCRHEVSRHSSSNECEEPGCSCIFEPESRAAFERTAVPPAPPPPPWERPIWWPLLLVLEHPFFLLVLLSFAMMGLYFGIEAAEELDWMARHRASVAWVKNALCLLSVPGLVVLWNWSPGMKTKDFRRRGPRWVRSVIAGLVIAFLLYYALKIFLAGR